MSGLDFGDIALLTGWTLWVLLASALWGKWGVFASATFVVIALWTWIRTDMSWAAFLTAALMVQAALLAGPYVVRSTSGSVRRRVSQLDEYIAVAGHISWGAAAWVAIDAGLVGWWAISVAILPVVGVLATREILNRRRQKARWRADRERDHEGGFDGWR